MAGINWKRVGLGAAVGGVAWFVLAAARAIFLGLLSSSGGGPGLAAPPGVEYSWIALLSCPFFAGLAGWLYASIRPRYGPGPRTALRSGLALGLALTMIDLLWGTAASSSLEYRIWSAIGMLSLAVAVALIVAWLYREAPGVDAGDPERLASGA